MKKVLIFVVACIVASTCFTAPVAAQDAVKWSAPLHEYPNPWTPTTPPPSYNNAYGYYPYGGYGYGAYSGGGYAPAYPQGGGYGGWAPFQGYGQ
jgi:hypothetical protein